MTADQAKVLADHYANLMEGEFATTCKILAAVKDDNKAFKLDDKSRSAWELATHLATADIWFLDSILNGKFEWNPDGARQAEAQFKTTSDVVDFYKKAMPERFARMRAMSPEQMTRTVDFFGFMQMPAVQLFGLANNHSIHHRGQLAANLRPMGSKVPSIYGGSADEPMRG